VARIVAAIDFGTHGTGFAWAFSSAREDEPSHRTIYTFDDWTDQPASYVKNLSAILLDGSGGVLAWGYEARRLFEAGAAADGDRTYAERFKMGLLPAEPPRPPSPANPPSRPGRGPRRARWSPPTCAASTASRWRRSRRAAGSARTRSSGA
jgi:hypothetical protein